MRWIGLVLLLASVGLPTAHGQPAPSSEPQWNVRVYPLDLWGPRVGWGFGAGVVAHDVMRPGSQMLVTAAPAAHETVGTLSLASADPHEADTYVVLDARAATTTRQWFYGLGPGSRKDAKVALDMNAWWTRLRVGQRLGASPATVQPHLTLMQHDVNGLSEETPDALSRLSAASRRAIPGQAPTAPSPSALRPADARQVGIRAGVDVIVDTRERAYGARRGVLLQGTASTYEALDQDLRFHRLDLRAFGFLPLGGRHRLALGLRTALTDRRSNRRLPFYLLPKLDGHTAPGWARDRFYGSDLASVRLVYRFPIAQFRDLVTLEGHVGAHAATVYDDLGDDWSLDLSFEERIGAGDAPFRPSASAGLRIGPLFRDETYVDVAVGVSPEDVTGVRFTFVQSLRGLRPGHHGPE